MQAQSHMANTDDSAGLQYLQDNGMKNIFEEIKSFHQNGAALIRGFASAEECKGMIEQMGKHLGIILSANL